MHGLGFTPVEAALRGMSHTRGYDIAGGTIVISMDQGAYSWKFVAVARSRQKMAPISDLGTEMGKFPGVQSFHVAYARN
jgi:putative Mg2+ transporter-C (MgtC) family protein